MASRGLAHGLGLQLFPQPCWRPYFRAWVPGSFCADLTGIAELFARSSVDSLSCVAECTAFYIKVHVCRAPHGPVLSQA